MSLSLIGMQHHRCATNAHNLSSNYRKLSTKCLAYRALLITTRSSDYNCNKLWQLRDRESNAPQRERRSINVQGWRQLPWGWMSSRLEFYSSNSWMRTLLSVDVSLDISMACAELCNWRMYFSTTMLHIWVTVPPIASSFKNNFKNRKKIGKTYFEFFWCSKESWGIFSQYSIWQIVIFQK